MKRLLSTMMAIAALGFAAGCGGATAPRDTAPADLTTDSGVTTETAPAASSGATTTDGNAPGPRRTEEPRPPVVPGSPIKYNSDLLGTDPATAKNAIEQNLADLCKSSRRCGVSVVITGEGNCIRSIGPNPVPPGGRIVILARTCKTETTKESSAPPKSESAKPSQSSGG
jgi:predicted small lipoprotein YifL